MQKNLRKFKRMERYLKELRNPEWRKLKSIKDSKYFQIK